MGHKSNLYNVLKLFCFTLVVTMTIAVIRPSPSHAQENTGMNAGCATDTWEAMINQAALETRREDLINKRYIVKADSVLQYSCFADEVLNMAKNGPPIFSGNTEWDKKCVKPAFPIILPDDGTQRKACLIIDPFKNGLTPKSLEEALSLVVDDALRRYIDLNFYHQVVSGTTELKAAGQLCYNMATVWKAAKCKNFDGTKVFYRFEDLINQDPREFPPSMPCG